MAYPSTSKSLIFRVQQGDEISWTEFYDKYKGIIAAVGKYKGLNEEECHDLVQAVMTGFFKTSGSFEFKPGVAKFRTYLGSIIVRKIADCYRLRARMAVDVISNASTLENLGEEASDPGFDTFFHQEWQKHLLEEARLILKSKVEDKTYLAFHLYAEKNKLPEDVATALGMSVNQVYTAKKRCISHLQNIIRDLQQADPAFGLDYEV